VAAVRAILEADIAYRARRLTTGGPAALFAELTQRLSLSPATTSHHLAALREAGLVTGRRDGRSVLYARTPLGDALSSGGSALGPSG
jgi:DNA-binding transcriptional ArsR family regulator